MRAVGNRHYGNESDCFPSVSKSWADTAEETQLSECAPSGTACIRNAPLTLSPQSCSSSGKPKQVHLDSTNRK